MRIFDLNFFLFISQILFASDANLLFYHSDHDSSVLLGRVME